MVPVALLLKSAVALCCSYNLLPPSMNSTVTLLLSELYIYISICQYIWHDFLEISHNRWYCCFQTPKRQIFGMWLPRQTTSNQHNGSSHTNNNGVKSIPQDTNWIATSKIRQYLGSIQLNKIGISRLSQHKNETFNTIKKELTPNDVNPWYFWWIV